MAGKPDLAATSGVQNVVVYVSNDNFAQAYTVGQQNVPSNAHLLHNPGYGNAPPSMSPVVSATKTFPEKQSIKPEYSSNDSSSVPSQGYFTNVISQNSFPQPLVNDVSYQNGAVIKNYGNGEVLSVERQAGPGRTEAKVREECNNRDMYVEPGYMTVMGAEMPSQSVRCDSVRSEAAESSCSSLSSVDESLLVVQNQQSEMVVYEGSVNVRPAGVVLAVGPPPLQQQAQNNTSTVGTLNSVQKPYVTVPHGWKRLNNGSIIYIRIGDTKEALELIIKELKDMQYAISFCREHDDSDLWDDLINHCVDKPEFVTFLLEGIGTYVDPTDLVLKIKQDMEIPGLKNSLVKMLNQYNLQVSVQEGCKKILVSDYFNLQKKLVNVHQRGLSVTEEMVCGACHRKLIEKDPTRAANIAIFNCKHAFHSHCMPKNGTICGICYTAEQK